MVVRELADEVLVYDLPRDKAFCLNKTAAAVWRRSDGSTTPSQMSSAITQELGIPVNDGSLAAWRERMTARQVKFGDAEMFMWRAIQRGIDRPYLDLYGAPAYLAWLKQCDLTPLAVDSTRAGGKVGDMPAWRYAGERIARKLPYGIRRVLRK